MPDLALADLERGDSAQSQGLVCLLWARSDLGWASGGGEGPQRLRRIDSPRPGSAGQSQRLPGARLASRDCARCHTARSGDRRRIGQEGLPAHRLEGRRLPAHARRRLFRASRFRRRTRDDRESHRPSLSGRPQDGKLPRVERAVPRKAAVPRIGCGHEARQSVMSAALKSRSSRGVCAGIMEQESCGR